MKRFNRLIPVFIVCLVFGYSPDAKAIENERDSTGEFKRLETREGWHPNEGA